MIRITKQRRLAIVAASVALSAVALAGCSSTNGGGGETGGNNLDGDIAAGSVGTVDQFADIADICPADAEDGSITLGVVDGGGTNSWSKTVLAEIESEAAKCPAIGKADYVAGSFDLETTTSGITSLAAKGTDIILVIPDAGPGEAHLPAHPPGHPGRFDRRELRVRPAGQRRNRLPRLHRPVAEVRRNDQGASGSSTSSATRAATSSFFGGPAGALVSTQEYAGAVEVFADNPQINLLSPEPIATNWDPAQAQQAMAGLLSGGDKIDAVIADYGASASGVIRAYEAAGITLPLITTTDDNSLSCGFADLKAANPGYELATVSSRTWNGRVALRKALAAFTGGSDQEPSIYNLALFEDSTGSTDGTVTPDEACLPDAPADATPSTLLTADEIYALFG